jgi:RNA polymerase sigma-54 factor
MTPQLQQAIKLLQMSRMELADSSCSEELLENPVLEDSAQTRRDSPRGPDPASSSQKPSTARSPRTTASSPPSRTKLHERRHRLGAVPREPLAIQAPMPSIRRGGDEEMPGVDQTLTRGEDLSSPHLLAASEWAISSRTSSKFGALVIGNLDDDGLPEVSRG